MNTQRYKERKSKIISVFWGMVFLLAGGGLLVGNSLGSEVQGPAIMFLFALCFIFLPIWSHKNWWAIIPGGIFASIGLVATVEILVPHEDLPSIQGVLSWGFYTWVLGLGLAATFGCVWLLHKTQPTDWAKYPAAGFLAIAVLFIIVGARFTEYWLATVMVVIGMMLLLSRFTRKNLQEGHPPPHLKT